MLLNVGQCRVHDFCYTEFEMLRGKFRSVSDLMVSLVLGDFGFAVFSIVICLRKITCDKEFGSCLL